MKTLKDLFKLIDSLEENQYLFMAFGGEYSFSIERSIEKHRFVLKVFKQYKAFDYPPLRKYEFLSESELRNVLKENPEWYARNAHTGQLQFFDNVVNFIDAFEVHDYKSQKNA